MTLLFVYLNSTKVLPTELKRNIKDFLKYGIVYGIGELLNVIRNLFFHK